MDYAERQRNPAKHLPSIAMVVVLHIALGYALVTGLVAEAAQHRTESRGSHFRTSHLAGPLFRQPLAKIKVSAGHRQIGQRSLPHAPHWRRLVCASLRYACIARMS